MNKAMDKVRKNIEVNMGVIITAAIAMSIFLLGLIANSTIDMNKTLYKFIYQNNAAHDTLKVMLLNGEKRVSENTKLIEENDKWGRLQFKKISSRDSSQDVIIRDHEGRILRIEKRVFH